MLGVASGHAQYPRSLATWVGSNPVEKGVLPLIAERMQEETLDRLVQEGFVDSNEYATEGIKRVN
jgi:hypothetical protein